MFDGQSNFPLYSFIYDLVWVPVVPDDAVVAPERNQAVYLKLLFVLIFCEMKYFICLICIYV